MAHVMKATMGAIGGLGRHYERYRDEKNGYVKFSNQEIDLERTHLNYNLAPARKNQIKFVKDTCEEIGYLKRADVNVMASWVVTLPKEIDTDEEQKIFFDEAYWFLRKRYGFGENLEENIVSSYVHLDETTPHMHFAFVPVYHNKEKETAKVNCSKVINKFDLQTFHGDLSKHMEKVFKRDIGILNGATVEGNKTKAEMQAEDIIADATRKADAIISEAKAEVASIRAETETKILQDIEIEMQENLPELKAKAQINDMRAIEEVTYIEIPERAKIGLRSVSDALEKSLGVEIPKDAVLVSQEQIGRLHGALKPLSEGLQKTNGLINRVLYMYQKNNEDRNENLQMADELEDERRRMRKLEPAKLEKQINDMQRNFDEEQRELEFKHKSVIRKLEEKNQDYTKLEKSFERSKKVADRLSYEKHGEKMRMWFSENHYTISEEELMNVCKYWEAGYGCRVEKGKVYSEKKDNDGKVIESFHTASCTKARQQEYDRGGR
jgi:hypothetical protein